MPIIEETIYHIQCDNCGDYLDEGAYFPLTNNYEINNLFSDADWRMFGGKVFCKKCLEKGLDQENGK